jgi:hypothetical protein
MTAGNEPSVDVAEPEQTRGGDPALADDAFWHRYLTAGDPRELALRKFFAHLPT